MMQMKYRLPDERITISVTSTGPAELKSIFAMLDGLEEALALTDKESFGIDFNTNLTILHLTDLSGEVRQWRGRLRKKDREGIVESLTERVGDRHRSLTEDIIRLRARRDSKMPQAWQYKTQPLIKRLIEHSGYKPDQFLKACGLHPGQIQNLAIKPKGEVSRTIKLKTVLPIKGHIKESEVTAGYIELGNGCYLTWQSGIEGRYNIQMPQPLPQTYQASLIGEKAACLVDDERAKAIFGDMTITGFGPQSGGHQIWLSREDDEMMEDQPQWVEEKHLDLNNRLAEWARA